MFRRLVFYKRLLQFFLGANVLLIILGGLAAEQFYAAHEISALELSIVGALSFLSLVIPQALFLIPLTRFPAFIWLVVAGFMLPKSKSQGQAPQKHDMPAVALS